MKTVIYIGLPRTASHSLQESMVQCGLKCVRDAKWAAEIARKARQGEIDKSVYEVQALFGFEMDIPVEELADLYEDAILVNIYRPVEDWVTSMLVRTAAYRKSGKHSEMDIPSTDHLRLHYDLHQRVVTDARLKHSDRVYSIPLDSLSWSSVCGMLKVAEPQESKDFPILNTGDDALRVAMRPAYTSGTDYVTHRIPHWVRLFSHLKGKPNLRFLEIGSYEGRSAIWWLENILTDQSSSLVCIDPWQLRSRERAFDWNIAISGQSHRVRKIRDFSRNAVSLFPEEHFDVIYVDGSHEAIDCLHDGLVSIPRLKENGILLFDDYRWTSKDRVHMPKMAIDYFASIADWQVDLVLLDYQAAFRKLTAAERKGRVVSIKAEQVAAGAKDQLHLQT